MTKFSLPLLSLPLLSLPLLSNQIQTSGRDLYVVTWYVWSTSSCFE